MAATAKLDAISKRVDEAFKASGASRPDNVLLRSLHADIELFRLDHKEEEFTAELDALVARVDLVPFSRPKRWWDKLEGIYRFSGIAAAFITFSVLCSIPMLLLKPIDDLLVKMGVMRPHNMISEHMKRFLSDWLGRVAGIVYVTEGIDVDFFEKHPVLLTFTHGSNLDAFLLASTCPVRNYALAKKELFCVPFFSWFAFACGGVPVDRNNREKAVLALKRVSDATQDGNICLVIAPEGTRSKSGQLLPFKKGAFHMWDDLRIPIVPVVIYGAFDLCPVGNWIGHPGRVYIRYLKPILPSEVQSRDEMADLVRRRVLLAMKECPKDIGAELSWAEWIKYLVSVIALFVVDGMTIAAVRDVAFNVFHLTGQELLKYVSFICVLITIGLYFYYVEIIYWGKRGKSTKKPASKSD